MPPRNDTIVMPPPKMWEAICKLSSLRKKAKSDETDLCKARRKLEDDLAKIGSETETVKTQKWRKVAADLKLVEVAIDTARANKAYFADRFEEAVDIAGEGRLFSDDEFNDLYEPGRAEEEGPLFRQAMDAAQMPAEDVGAAAAPLTLESTLSDVPGLSSKGKQALKDAGLLTLADAKKFFAETPKHGVFTAMDAATADLVRSVLRTVDPEAKNAGGTPAHPNGVEKKGRGGKRSRAG